ncbi:hypothetical protein FACS18949_16500 [Clostridia bacterium]|nr:hypothetical protein FACS18949_16500 [Clostridia bacterium]
MRLKWKRSDNYDTYTSENYKPLFKSDKVQLLIKRECSHFTAKGYKYYLLSETDEGAELIGDFDKLSDAKAYAQKLQDGKL